MRNLTSDEGEAEEGMSEGEKVERYKRAVREGDVQRVVTWAGAFARSVFLEFGFERGVLMVRTCAQGRAWGM